MDIQQTFEVYQRQLENIRKNNYYGRPQVLRQFRIQFKGFSETDIQTLKAFLVDKEKKWFVAHLLDNLDTFPVDLLKSILYAAVQEPDPSFNNEFIKPCRRVFDYVDIQEILLDIFRNGSRDEKIGVLKALYWARRTVYELTVHEGSNVYQQKGHDTFFWDYELKSFNEDFKEDKELYNREAPKQESIYKEQVKTIIEEFYKTNDVELKYQISLGLPKKVDDFPNDLQELATKFLNDKKREGVANNISELQQVDHVRSPFLRRLLLSARRLFAKKGRITLKQR